MSVIQSSGVSTLQGILVLKVIEICSRHSELSFISRVEGCPLSGVQLFDKCMCHPNMIGFFCCCLFDVCSTELATQLHTDEEIDRGDHDLHYLPVHPPNSLEEYQRAAEADESVKNKTCTLI